MLTVHDFSEVWLASREKSGRYKRTTIARDRELMTHDIIPALGHRILTELTPADIAAFWEKLSAQVNLLTGKPKVHTARRAAVVLRRLFNDAIAQDLLRENPTRHLKLPSVPRDQPREISLVEIERLVAATRDDYKPLVLVAMLTGMRFGEIRELRWKDIDFEGGLIHIRRQRPTHESGSIRPPKWDGVRTVDIMDPVRQVLKNLAGGKAEAFVFPASGGGPINPTHFRRHVWNPALVRSGIRMKPHETRDVFVSLLIAFGEDIMRITRQTGHRNLAVFFGHYAHEIQRCGGTLSKEETYQRLTAAFKTPADPERAMFLSVNQAANALGVSWGWLFELVRNGKVPATKRGQWLIPRDALAQIRLPRSRRRPEPSPGIEKW